MKIPYPIILFAVLGYLVGGCGFRNSFLETAATKQTADKMERSGRFKADQYLKILNLADSTVRTGRISDADLYYLLGEMYSHQSSSSQPGYVRMRAAIGLIGVRHFGPGQKEKIVLASLKMLKSKDRLEQRAALELAIVHQDSRAHPLIFPLTQSPHQKTRDLAKAFLLHQGYELDLPD